VDRKVTTQTTDNLSPLARLIAGRKRTIHQYDVAGFLNLKGEAIPKMGFIVPTKTESDDAIIEAHKKIGARTAGCDSARSDEDVGRDLKIVHILHKACIDPTPKQSGPKQPVFHDPIFPSPLWIADHLNTDEIGVLLNLLNEARRADGPEPDFDDVTVEKFIEAAGQAKAAGTDAIAELLAACGREFVVQLFIASAIKLTEAREEIVKLTAPLDEPIAEVEVSDGAGDQG
jgi:hypothetical protein